MVTSCLRAFVKKAALQVFPAAAITTLSLGSPTMACPTQYTVKDGDILTEVALDQFGSYDATEAIAASNADLLEGNPHKLEIGMQLQLPCGDKEALWSVMIDSRALAKLTLTSDIQILDIRDWDDVGAGVVPGAVSLPYAMWRGPETNPGLPPSDARLANLIGHAGLDLRVPIVIVHRSVSAQDTGQAAKTYWILKSAGAKQLAILKTAFKAGKVRVCPLLPHRLNRKQLKSMLSFRCNGAPMCLMYMALQQIRSRGICWTDAPRNRPRRPYPAP